jgi:uncharacterized protein
VTAAGQRVAVVHVHDSPEDLEAALSTAARLRDALQDVLVRVIVNGPALPSTVGPDPLNVTDGVEVSACAVAMARQGYDATALRPGVVQVPSAAVALVDAQLSGAAYLRL